MVRAIIDCRKTQTRRLVKPQPQRVGWYTQDDLPGVQFDWHEVDEDGDPTDSLLRCPYGEPGDRLWVRETFAYCVLRTDITDERYSVSIPRDRYTPPTNGSLHSYHIAYRADEDPGDDPLEGPWRPSIHMPRWVSRLTLEVTDVHIERLRDISEADAIAEGLIPVGGLNSQQMWAYSETTGGHFVDPRVAFHMLWNSIHGTESWTANPWVWVVEFRKVNR